MQPIQMLVHTYNTDLSTGVSSATLSTECHNGPDKKRSGCYARLVIASPSEVMSFHWHTYANLPCYYNAINESIQFSHTSYVYIGHLCTYICTLLYIDTEIIV